MSQERIFCIAIFSYSLYLYSSKNLSEVRQLVRYLFDWLPFDWSFELSYFLSGQIVLPVICFFVPFILFSGLFQDSLMKETIKAVVKNWSLMTIKDELSLFQILWGVIYECDEREYKKGDYLCSSRIFSIKDSHVKTLTGSCYKLIGEGSEYVCSYVQLISLISGLSPEELQLKQLRAGISPLELYK